MTKNVNELKKAVNEFGNYEYCRASVLAEKFDVAVSTIWMWSKSGQFPKPVKLTPKCTVWILAEVQEWIDGRISNRKVA